MDKQIAQERPGHSHSGLVSVCSGLAFVLGAAATVYVGQTAAALFMAALILLGALWCFAGLYILQPNQAALLMLFGSYGGTDRSDGLRWSNPFYVKKKLSIRAYTFNSEKLKVNDLRGNPIEIAAAIVWRVKDTARASFDVEDFTHYVVTQSESAVRHLASSFAYDNLYDTDHTGAKETTLRSGAEVVAAALRAELQARFALAGIQVIDAKLTHLAYAPEIAGTMLRRQQAEAVVAARSKIVEGAVGMVELALNGLSERGLLNLDDERKAAMVCNLLVVLCSDHDATPVVNAGTLYN